MSLQGDPREIRRIKYYLNHTNQNIFNTEKRIRELIKQKNDALKIKMARQRLCLYEERKKVILLELEQAKVKYHQ